MDRREMSQIDRADKQEEQVPTSPCASYEKPRVPLTNLKMKFERGEEAMSKVFAVLKEELQADKLHIVCILCICIHTIILVPID